MDLKKRGSCFEIGRRPYSPDPQTHAVKRGSGMLGKSCDDVMCFCHVISL